MYSLEVMKIKKAMDHYIFDLLQNHSAFIAVGAITSIFTDARINDFDIFFRTKEALDLALAYAPKDEKTVETDSAISLISGGHRVQLVKVAIGEPKEIIKNFDFTICQAAYDLQEGFIFGEEFFQHLAQRRLVFNISADYPICSLYRLQKFTQRGFHFSGIEAIKLGLRIQALDLSTYAELRRQLMGIDTLFLKELTDSLAGKEEKDYEFNEFMATLTVWLDRLNTITGEE